jgi:DNA repair protein RadA/Sms
LIGLTISKGFRISSLKNRRQKPKIKNQRSKIKDQAPNDPMKNSLSVFVCQSCGHHSRKWLGKCPECGEWNSLVEERAPSAKKGSARNAFSVREVTAVPFIDIEPQDDVRVLTGLTEFDRVLGGGIVPGTLVLIGGDPGIGKSTLLLQVADQLSQGGTVVLYV